MCKIGAVHSRFSVDRAKDLVNQYLTPPLLFATRSVKLHEAPTSPEAANWTRAIEEEYKQLHDFERWYTVYLPLDHPANVVDTKWILTWKYRNCVFDKYKARFVVGQVHGLEYQTRTLW